MKLSDAIALLQHDDYDDTEPQLWADLGCGSGLFTLALAGSLHKGSTIFAVDKDIKELNKINSTETVTIQAIPADFIKDPLPIARLHGIIMANSLHYVKDKKNFIDKINSYLRPDSSLLIVEYDTDIPVSTWVPYPVSFQSLVKLFSEAGYAHINKLHTHPSVYNNGTLYSALIKR